MERIYKNSMTRYSVLKYQLIVADQLAIAQLVERWTVAVNLSSIGRWFDSDLRDFLYKPFFSISVIIMLSMRLTGYDENKYKTKSRTKTFCFATTV